MQLDRSLETHVKAPFRRYKLFVSHDAKNLAGKAVKVFNKDRGNEMLARNSQEHLLKNLVAIDTKHIENMDGIHAMFDAPAPRFYYHHKHPQPSVHIESRTRAPPPSPSPKHPH